VRFCLTLFAWTCRLEIEAIPAKNTGPYEICGSRANFGKRNCHPYLDLGDFAVEDLTETEYAPTGGMRPSRR
jgi:hypothetical protein